ncbi:MAG TPA: GNAT family N-acetyltransferase, partial [Anaerolinea sp.]|nr:GNAT family N-acetyltransferase [Anaerolinea sp.]
TSLLPDEKYRGEIVVALCYIGRHTFVQLDPAYLPHLVHALDVLPQDASLTGDDLRRIWGTAAIKSSEHGLFFYLYPPDLPNYLPAAPFTLRQLTPADQGAMEDLHAALTTAEVEEGAVEVSHEVAFGCFLNDQLVAASSGYRRTGFMDIGVLTHPRFRRRGLGKAVVGRLCEWIIHQGLIAQYRCDETNAGSRAVAEGLNFRLYFRSEDLYLQDTE